MNHRCSGPKKCGWILLLVVFLLLATCCRLAIGDDTNHADASDPTTQKKSLKEEEKQPEAVGETSTNDPAFDADDIEDSDNIEEHQEENTSTPSNDPQENAKEEEEGNNISSTPVDESEETEASDSSDEAESRIHMIEDLAVLEALLLSESFWDTEDTTTEDDESSQTTEHQLVPSLLLVAFVYKETGCEASRIQLPIFRQAVQDFLDNDESLSISPTTKNKTVHFLEIPVRPTTIPLLDSLSQTHVPTIIFLNPQPGDVTKQEPQLLLSGSNFIGSMSTVDELKDGFRHYLSRIGYSHWDYQMHPVRQGVEYLQGALILNVDSIEELQDIVTQGQLLSPYTPTPLDPKLSKDEQAWIRYLLKEEESEYPDPMFVICHCRDDNNDDDEELASEFNALASILSLRRNVAFCVLTEETHCPWQIQSFQVDPNTLQLTPHSNYSTPPQAKQHETRLALQEYLSRLLRPTLLWLDRQNAAPIAFSPYYKVHAVLFVDFHFTETKQDMQRAVQEFRQQCRNYHDNNLDGDNSMVCLVVPSTETRLLTTFGIDMWSRLDQEFLLQTTKQEDTASTTASVTQPDNHATLPTLLITDEREIGMGIRRYYLDPPITNIDGFFKSFWQGQLQPEIKSTTRYQEGDTNSHNVHLVSADTLAFFLDSSGNDKKNDDGNKKVHKLLMLYAPTCGHCKRLNIAWNSLGELIEYFEWHSKIQIGRLDVSANEFFIPNATAPWLPEIFYFGPSADDIDDEDEAATPAVPIRFHKQNLEVGAINDPLDIIEWLLDVAVNDDEMDPKVLLKALQPEPEQ